MFSGLAQGLRYAVVQMKYKINAQKYLATLIKPGSHIVFIFSWHEKDFTCKANLSDMYHFIFLNVLNFK